MSTSSPPFDILTVAFCYLRGVTDEHICPRAAWKNKQGNKEEIPAVEVADFFARL